MSVRWRKLRGDVISGQGRMFLMVLAIMIGLFGVGVILGAYSILTREIARNYATTNPASASLELNRVDETLLAQVRLQPGIVSAEASSTVLAKLQRKNGEWVSLLLFVIPDFVRLSINRFTAEAGAWPPPTGSLLLERQALSFVGANIGDALIVQTPHGAARRTLIAGTVHDPGLAPASQEQTAWGYITPATLAQLGERQDLQILKVIVREQNLQGIETRVQHLAQWLQSQGHTLEEIRIPPPGKHPHQTQMTTILLLLLLFSVMALLLGGILVANTVAALLGQQIRQIGIMKTIGARTAQIASMYLALVAIIGTLSTLIAVPLGVLAARGLSSVIAELLNFNITNQSIPIWVFLVQVMAGVLVPLLIAWWPIWNATRITVRQALDSVGVNRNAMKPGGFDTWLSHWRGLDASWMLSMRNTFRRRGRLVLILGLLATAGALFITSLNVQAAWQRTLHDAAQDRHYDTEIRLEDFKPTTDIARVLTGVSDIEHFEVWNRSPAALARPDQLAIVHTYPDGGHGSFTLRSRPVGSQLLNLTMLAGSWPTATAQGGIVLNHSAKALFPGAQIGERIALNINGRIQRFKLLGVARELISPATGYLAPASFARATGQPDRANALRLVLTRHDPQSVTRLSAQAEQALERAGIRVNVNISETKLEAALSGHVSILIFALGAIAVLMALVGGLGLMSTMSTSVIERTREYGVMRAIGARSSTVLRNVLSEGFLIGVLSWLLAVPLSLPISLWIGTLVGTMSFRYPLSLTLSMPAVLTWLGVLLIGSGISTLFPAMSAARLTIRETLAYL